MRSDSRVSHIKVICFFVYIIATIIDVKIFKIVEKNQDNEGLHIFVGRILIIRLVLVGFWF